MLRAPPAPAIPTIPPIPPVDVRAQIPTILVAALHTNISMNIPTMRKNPNIKKNTSILPAIVAVRKIFH